MSAKKTTKSRSKKHDAVPAVAGIDPAPALTDVPTPPAGWVKPANGAPHARRPLAVQKRAAAGAAGELSGSTDYETEFGAGAPSREDLGSALGLAGAWSSAIDQVGQWVQYARQQEADAWQHVFGMSDALQPMFESTVARRPEVATEFVSLARFYTSGHVNAARSASTRKANNKAKSKAQTAAPTATAPVALTAVPSAPGVKSAA